MVRGIQNRNPIFKYLYVGQHTSRFIFHQFIPIQWILDDCWANVYNHDSSGHNTDGSLDLLVKVVLAGKRAKLRWTL